MDDKAPLINPGDENNTVEVECSSEEEVKSVDDILTEAGGFGRFQVILLLMCMSFSNSFSFQTLSMYFAADDPPWQCTNFTSDFCKHNFQKSIPESSDDFEHRCKLNRNEWSYTTDLKYSLITEFDLVCSKEYLKALTTSGFFIGCGLGSIIAGPLSDLYGRRLVIRLAMILLFVSSISCSFITAVWQFIFLRVLIGAAFGGNAMCIYILLSEFNAPKKRGIVGNIYFIGFTISMLLLTLVSYYVREWRRMLLYTSFPSGMSFILSLFLYESPHWLSAKGKTEKAVAVLKKIATVNRKVIQINLKKPPTADEKSKKYSYLDFFKNFKVFILVIVQCALWFVAGLSFYGIALESSNLGGSIYLNFILSSLADVPGYILATLSTVYIGRKKSVGFGFLIAAVLLCAIGFTPESQDKVRVALAVTSRITLTVSFNTLFLWTFEIFPTVLRAQGMNICQIFTRAGSAGAPFLTEVLKSVNPALPFYIMGGFGILAASLCVVLPETIKKPIRENYEDFFESSDTVAVYDEENDHIE